MFAEIEPIGEGILIGTMVTFLSRTDSKNLKSLLN